MMILWVVPHLSWAQAGDSLLSGKVSYKSSQNIYVKFDNTQLIQGDTLYIRDQSILKPVLVISSKSSISCVCHVLPDVTIEIGDIILALRKPVLPEPGTGQIITVDSTELSDSDKNSMPSIKETKSAILQQDISGRISVSSYVNLSNTEVRNFNRMQYAWLFNGNHLLGSNLSIDSYLILRYKTHEWNDAVGHLNNALKIYNLGIKYNFKQGTQLVIGRKINPLIANLGAIDGVQVEQKIKNFTVGALVGSRPDYTDYGFNFNLRQFGGYVHHGATIANRTVESSLGLVEQKNLKHTDRRFIYFQHNNNLLKSLTVFASFEANLYKSINNQSANDFSISSIFCSIRYRVNPKLSFSASYDALRNIIYYESYKNFIDKLIEDEMRQGLRFQFNYHPVKYLFLGGSGGYRFQNGVQTPASKNFYTYLMYTKVPGIHGTTNLSYTWLQTPYLQGRVIGWRLSRDFMRGNFFVELESRYAEYHYSGKDDLTRQFIEGLNLSWRLFKTISLSINTEMTFEKKIRYSRLYTNIIKRF